MGATAAVEHEAELGRMRWRCRRGMRELDQLLRGWLDAAGAGATSARLASFAALLECEDSDLWDWLSGRSRPLDATLAGLIDEIRATHRA